MVINKNKVMEAGRKAYLKGQFDKAIKEYLKVVKEDPKDVRVWLKIGDLYARKDAKLEATDTYMKVAKFYSDQGFYLKAVAVYKQILKVDPRLVEVNLKLAELYKQLGLLSDAMQHFEMVAAFFHREGKTREALATLRQLVDLDPENVATRIKLAELYSKEGMAEEAVAEFSTTCEFLRKNGRQDDFVKVAERLLFHDQENIDLCQELASLYLQRNDPRRALAKLQICFKANQNDPSVLALLAQAFQRLEQKGKTVSVLKELARVHADSGKRQEAEEVHCKILEYLPDDSDSLKFLGRTARPSQHSDSASASSPPVQSSPEPRPASSRGHAMGKTTGSMPLIEPDERAEYGRPEPVGTASNNAHDQGIASKLEIDSQSKYVPTETHQVNTEESSDEIVKILTETDVYIKYGLHEKAIDHLRKVFEIDERNIEARERLQDILIKEGREAEGVRELQVLAEHTVGANPQQALAHIRTILSIDGGNVNALEFAARHRLDVGDGTTPPIHNPSEQLTEADDQQDPLGDAPLDQRAPAYSAADTPNTMTAGTGGTASGTRRDEVNYDFGLDGASPGAQASTGMEPGQTENVQGAAEGDTDDLDFGLERPKDPLALGSSADPYPDPANLAPSGFDSEATGQDIEELDIELIEEISDEDLISEDDVDDEVFVESGESSSSNLEEDLDEAEFFLSQNLLDEAEDIVNALVERYPNNPLVASKLEEVRAARGTGAAGTSPQDDSPQDDSLLGDFGDDSLFGGFEEATGHDSSPPEHLESTAPVVKTSLRTPSVVLENPIDEDDSDTHFDLGLAYKEMGLLSEAIAAFQKVIEVPGREVQCRLMVGLCHREDQSLSEAISQFKAGLYVDEITGPEKFSLYYEIGLTYEELQDPQEALYYYEMVLKKEADYRDVSDRVASIKSSM